ncbi:MAG: hypothetical protein QM640_07465 [Niabella sp.]
MKSLKITVILFAFILISCHPVSKSNSGSKLKARFEVKALCSNYTFSIIEGAIDTSMVEASWTNPQTNKTYKNAFGIKNPCDLPANLKEGDEFYFEIDNKQSKPCVACMAYYPTPAKKLNIKVLSVVKK